jgi:hypothetical protein
VGRAAAYAAAILAFAYALVSVDRTALRWHVGVWDLWFLAWGIFLALATIGYARRTVNRTAA